LNLQKAPSVGPELLQQEATFEIEIQKNVPIIEEKVNEDFNKPVLQ